MITIFKKKAIPKGMELITLNDVFFNKYTAEQLDERAASIISTIDQSEMDSRFFIRSGFDDSLLNIDKLSSGCKTALNALYNPNKVFDIRECGDNALDVIYALPCGNIYCDYPFISFEMDSVIVCDNRGTHEIDSYEKLKEWWINED